MGNRQFITSMTTTMTETNSSPNNPIQLNVADNQPLVWGLRTYVMGIINVSPDSFSGDGFDCDVQGVIDQGLRFQTEGADILDLGAQSTRPGYQEITDDEELRRLMPALEGLIDTVDIPISVDTHKPVIAKAAIETGASMINDIWGLKYNPDIALISAEYETPIVMMHNQSTTDYSDLIPNMLESLNSSINLALQSGVAKRNIIIDPGIGFGKTPDQNLEIIKRLKEFLTLGYPILIGTSRKSTIGYILDAPPDQRIEGTASTIALSIAEGVDIIRVHDVKEMVKVSRMTDAIVRGWRPENW